MIQCFYCGKEIEPQLTISAIRETSKATTSFCECPACPYRAQPMQEHAEAHTNWGGHAARVVIAEKVGEILGDGEFYKKGAFGFIRENGAVVAILTFEGREPEVKPLCDGFGTLDVEVSIEQDEEEQG